MTIDERLEVITGMAMDSIMDRLHHDADLAGELEDATVFAEFGDLDFVDGLRVRVRLEVIRPPRDVS